MLCLSLIFCQAFSSLADIDGDTESELKTEVFYDDTMLMSVNDDLADYNLMPVFYLMAGDLDNKYYYANTIKDLSGNQNVTFAFNGNVLNAYPSYQKIDVECVLTFTNGYDPSVIRVISSSSAITGVGGFKFRPTASANSSYYATPTGFSYVDDSTIRISYSYYSSSGIYNGGNYPALLQLSAASYLKGNSVTCKFYYKLSNQLPDTDIAYTGGGDGGGGSEGGGGAAT